MGLRRVKEFTVDVVTVNERPDPYYQPRAQYRKPGDVRVLLKPRRGDPLVIAEIRSTDDDFDDQLAQALSKAEDKIAVLRASNSTAARLSR